MDRLIVVNYRSVQTSIFSMALRNQTITSYNEQLTLVFPSSVVTGGEVGRKQTNNGTNYYNGNG